LTCDTTTNNNRTKQLKRYEMKNVKLNLKNLLSISGRSITEIHNHNYSKEAAMEAVKRNGYALQYVKDQTADVCMEAVKRNGYALQYVKDQTADVCMEAVKQDGEALRYVKDQTADVCMEAVKQDGYALQYVDPNLIDDYEYVEPVKPFEIGGYNVEFLDDYVMVGCTKVTKEEAMKIAKGLNIIND